MPRWLRENGLSIVLFGLFGVFLVGQGLTGWRTYNAEQREHHEQTVGLEAYLTTGHFVEATFEKLGERIPSDGLLRLAHRLAGPEGFFGVEATRRRSREGCRPPSGD